MVPTGTTYIDYTKYVNGYAMKNEHIKIILLFNSPKKGTGAVKNSFHTKGMAADMQIKGMSPSQVANTIEQLINAGKMQQGGLGRYPNFTHYDIRGTKQRW